MRWQPLQCMETLNTHVCKRMHEIHDYWEIKLKLEEWGNEREMAGGVCVYIYIYTYIYIYFRTWHLKRGRGCSCSAAVLVAAAIVVSEGE